MALTLVTHLLCCVPKATAAPRPLVSLWISTDSRQLELPLSVCQPPAQPGPSVGVLSKRMKSFSSWEALFLLHALFYKTQTMLSLLNTAG